MYSANREENQNRLKWHGWKNVFEDCSECIIDCFFLYNAMPFSHNTDAKFVYAQESVHYAGFPNEFMLQRCKTASEHLRCNIQLQTASEHLRCNIQILVFWAHAAGMLRRIRVWVHTCVTNTVTLTAKLKKIRNLARPRRLSCSSNIDVYFIHSWVTVHKAYWKTRVETLRLCGSMIRLVFLCS